MLNDIFLCYGRSDAEMATALVESLESRGARVWWDQKIGKGQDWRDSIVENIEDSSVVVILFSEDSNSSKQLKKELAIADHMDKMVIPVLIEKTEPKGHFLYELATRNWIELFPDALSKVDKLSDDLLDIEEVRSGWAGEEPEAEETPEPEEEEPDEKAAEEKEAKKPKEKKQAMRTPVPLEVKGKMGKRDFLPFAWYDVVPVGLLTVPLLALKGMAHPGISTAWVAAAAYNAALSAALYGVVAFPVRYYIRRRSPSRTVGMLALSYVVLLAVFEGAVYSYAAIIGRSGYYAPPPLLSLTIFGGLAAVAFLLYWVLSWRRARKIRRANTKSI